MVSKEKFPCKNCDKRYVGCHGSCEEYKEAKKKNDKEREEIRYLKKRESDARGFAIDTHDRIMKRMNKKWYKR